MKSLMPSIISHGSRIALVALLAVLASGCTVSQGTDFDVPRFVELATVNKATKEDFSSAIGDPDTRGTGHMAGIGAVEVWQYFYVEASMSSSQQKTAFLFFNEQGVLASYFVINNFE